MRKSDYGIIVISLIVIIGGFLLSSLIKNHTKIFMVTYETSIKGNTYLEKSYNTLKTLDKICTIKQKESLNKKLFNDKVNSAISRGADLIFVTDGTSLKESKNIAKANPEVSICVLDTEFKNKELSKNLCGMKIDISQNAFLAGYIAGKTTRTNKVGFVGAKKDSSTINYEEYYIKGVMHANKNATILTDYAGTYEDQMMGSNIAEIQYNEGVDIIFQAAGNTGLGVIEKSKILGKWVIGSNVNQNNLAPDNMLASVMKDSGKAMKRISEEYLKEKNIGGKNYVFTNKEKITNIIISKNVDIETKNEIEKLKSDIESGKLNID